MAPTTTSDSGLEKGLLWKTTACEVHNAPYVRAARWAGNYLRPEWGNKPENQNTPLRRTAYLDGLRGFAALLVYFGHHQLWAHDAIGAGRIFDNAYGFEGKYYFVALPGIRTFFNGGHFAVTVFFVMSGYVLSTKPLALIQAGDQAKLADTVASALFRRWLRLNLPVMATTLIYLTIWHVFRVKAVPDAKSTFGEELWSWYAEFKNFSFIFRTGGEPWFTYNFHAWSIPVEFRGSIVIYTALLAFSRCARNVRLACEALLIVYFLYIADGWFCALFMCGMLLCDLDLLAASNALPSGFSRLERYKKPFFYVLLVASFYLGGVPSGSFEVSDLRQNPGWYYLSFLKPQAVFDPKWFYLFWASSFLVAAIPRLPWLKRFFETRLNQYLGQISFSLYLVHGPVLWILGDRLYASTGWIKEDHAVRAPGWINRFRLPRAGPLGLEVNFLAPQLILLPLTLWLAELVTKMIDEPSVRFAQWLYRRTLPSAPPKT